MTSEFCSSRRKRIVPIYEYQCDDCADRFEVKQSMKDDPLTTCPRCGKHVQRLISSPAIMFKGSGWYVTDYSDKMKQTTAERDPESITSPKKDGSDKEAANPASPLAASAPALSPVSAAVRKE